MQSSIQSIHSLYCKLTGFDIRLDMHREHCWHDYLKAGFTEDDLRLVIKHVNWMNKQNRPVIGLKFHSLIVRLDYFEETLAEARSLNRNKPDSGKASALAATARKLEPPPARSVEQIMAGMKAAQEFSALRNVL